MPGYVRVMRFVIDTFGLPAPNLAAARPAMKTMVAAGRAETAFADDTHEKGRASLPGPS